jgi:hypothetical protein
MPSRRYVSEMLPFRMPSCRIGHFLPVIDSRMVFLPSCLLVGRPDSSFTRFPVLAESAKIP